MAFAMIDDLTGDSHPVEAAHKLTLHLDRHLVAEGDTSEIAGWDVASTDPRELLAQLGEHLSGVAAPLRPVGPLPGVESLRQALKGVRGGPPPALDADADADADADEARAGGAEVRQPTPAGGQDTDPGDEDATDDPEVVEQPAVVPAPRPAPRPTAPERVAEAVGGQATDATIRLWAHQHNVPCSMTGKLNAWARAGYLRVQGGAPDQQLWEDYRASIKPSPAARPADETPSPPDPSPPAGRAATAPTAPDRAGRGPDGPPAPAPSGKNGSGAGADQGRPRPEQLDLAEELAADGATPMTIVNRTGVSLVFARELVSKAKGPRR
ncbi:hypothetical protein GCM10023201_41390 [Actinomycetospora corticicola]